MVKHGCLFMVDNGWSRMLDIGSTWLWRSIMDTIKNTISPNFQIAWGLPHDWAASSYSLHDRGPWYHPCHTSYYPWWKWHMYVHTHGMMVHLHKCVTFIDMNTLLNVPSMLQWYLGLYTHVCNMLTNHPSKSPQHAFDLHLWPKKQQKRVFCVFVWDLEWPRTLVCHDYNVNVCILDVSMSIQVCIHITYKPCMYECQHFCERVWSCQSSLSGSFACMYGYLQVRINVCMWDHVSVNICKYTIHNYWHIQMINLSIHTLDA